MCPANSDACTGRILQAIFDEKSVRIIRPKMYGLERAAFSPFPIEQIGK